MDVVVAAFDVDHTLTVRDCVVPFMKRVAGPTRFLSGLVSSPIQVFKLVIGRDRDALKKHFVNQYFAGASCDEVNDMGVRFAARIADGWMREDVVHRMRWHQEQGHVVLFVSASLSPYLQPLGDLCEVDAVLCTELEHDNGVFTGQLVGENCRGPEKVHRLHQWLDDAGISRDAVTYAYGDSSGDDALLACAVHGIRVTSELLERTP